MLYGMYISAAGMMASSHKQDVIANNLANSETVGFKRDLALFTERLPESQAPQWPNAASNRLLDKIGGGLFVSPSVTDTSAGEMETTNGPLDVAIVGPGYLQVEALGKKFLSRDGRLAVNNQGNLIQAATGANVLSGDGQPIKLDPTIPTNIAIDGTVEQNRQPIARIGRWDVADNSQIRKVGGNRLTILNPNGLKPVATEVRNGMLERSNVDPASELSSLMETQRELEANANMIRYQDQSLGRLITEVGKIG